jgi:hypothetical protein
MGKLRVPRGVLAPSLTTIALIGLLGALLSDSVGAEAVKLQNATATFSQGPLGGGPYSPAMATDGIFYTGTACCSNGWTIDRLPEDVTASEIAVWQTSQNLGPGSLTFTMYFLDPNPRHFLGRFRWSVTTDKRSTYADGLPVDGKVTANWTVLTNPVLQVPTGMTVTILSDESILLGGAVPAQGLYQVEYATDLKHITGIRLEVLEDATLPASGPGFAANGNFVLTEVELDTCRIWKKRDCAEQ